MVIPLHILLPSAVFAVLLLSLFIWWITGTKNRIISEAVITDYMNRYYPGQKVAKIIVDGAANIGFIKLAGQTDIRLIRPLGNKLIDQNFELSAFDLAGNSKDSKNLHLPRQGIAFPPIDVQIKAEDLCNLLSLKEMQT